MLFSPLFYALFLMFVCQFCHFVHNLHQLHYVLYSLHWKIGFRTLPMYEWYIRNVRMVHPQCTKLTFVSLPAQNACG